MPFSILIKYPEECSSKRLHITNLYVKWLSQLLLDFLSISIVDSFTTTLPPFELWCIDPGNHYTSLYYFGKICNLFDI